MTIVQNDSKVLYGKKGKNANLVFDIQGLCFAVNCKAKPHIITAMNWGLLSQEIKVSALTMNLLGNHANLHKNLKLFNTNFSI